MKKRLLSVALVCAMLAAMFVGLSTGVGAVYADKTLTNGAWSVKGSAIDAARITVADHTDTGYIADADGNIDPVCLAAAFVSESRLACVDLEFAEGGKTGDSTVSISYTDSKIVDGADYCIVTAWAGQAFPTNVKAVGNTVTLEHSLTVGSVAILEGAFMPYGFLAGGSAIMPVAPISDVAEDDDYYTAINFAVISGFISTKADGSFLPDEAISREAAATALYRLSGSVDVETNPLFVDVAPRMWYTDGCNWSALSNLMAGIGDAADKGLKVFGVGDKLTNEQLIEIYYRMALSANPDMVADETAGMAIKEFADYESVSDWAYDAVVWGIAKGIVVADEDNNINPQREVTRAEFAQGIYNAYDAIMSEVADAIASINVSLNVSAD